MNDNEQVTERVLTVSAALVLIAGVIGSTVLLRGCQSDTTRERLACIEAGGTVLEASICIQDDAR